MNTTGTREGNITAAYIKLVVYRSARTTNSAAVLIAAEGLGRHFLKGALRNQLLLINRQTKRPGCPIGSTGLL